MAAQYQWNMCMIQTCCWGTIPALSAIDEVTMLLCCTECYPVMWVPAGDFFAGNKFSNLHPHVSAACHAH